MEFERFFDLVHGAMLSKKLGPNGYANKHRYYPIPTPALNANPNLEQNPGMELIIINYLNNNA